MPAKSAAQLRFMRAVAHSPAFAKKAGVPQSVGQEFSTPGYRSGGAVGGALQACTCGARRMAEGGSVEDLSDAEYYRRMEDLLTRQRGGGRRPEWQNASRDVNMPLQTARGWLAGTMGLPGDMESLARGFGHLVVNPATLESLRGAGEAMKYPTLPNSEFYKEWLPGADERPAAQFAGGLGSLFGGVGAGKVAQGARRVGNVAQGALNTLGDVALAPVPRRASQLGAIRMRGGNFDTKQLQGILESESANAPQPVQDWMRTNLSNYIRKDLGAPTDPLLALEKELQDLHLPEGTLTAAPPLNQVDHLYRMAGNRQVGGLGVEARKTVGDYLDKHHELSGGARLTPWGRVSDAQLFTESAKNNLAREMSNELPSWTGGNLHIDESVTPEMHSAWVADQRARGRRLTPKAKIAFEEQMPKFLADWRAKQPDVPIHTLMGEAPEQLGFNHIRDYLNAATGAHSELARLGGAEKVRGYPPGMGGRLPNEMRSLALHDAGLTLDPASLPRLSVADAVRKTAAWNKHLAESGQGATPGLEKGWQVHKEYPETGMKWVKFGPDRASGLPDGVTEHVAPNGQVAYRDEKAGTWIGNEHPSIAALREGLNAEGQAMGHCVGGYCDEVADNGTQIYSLRDAKNNPHVTVEVSPPGGGRLRDELQLIPDPEYANPKSWAHLYSKQPTLHDRVNRERGGNGDYPEHAWRVAQQFGIDIPPDIKQIKGKQNAAPVEKYLPHVQDFVKSGKWGDVRDLQNAGLAKFSGGKKTIQNQNLGSRPAKGLVFTVELPTGYMTHPEASEFLQKQGVPKELADRHIGYIGQQQEIEREGYAEGGSVKADPFDELDHLIDLHCINHEGAY